MQETLPAVLGDLLAATTFEDAAASTLRALMSLAGDQLAKSEWAKRGRILRGMVHLRPDDGYRRLVVLENEASAAPADVSSPGEGYLPSGTAWRWVAQNRCPVSIDVSLGTVQPHAPGVAAMVDSPGRREGFDSQESRLRLLGREATHVHVLPLRGPGGVAVGMITLEADCRAATGKDFFWGEIDARAQILADVATPHLATLPSRPYAASRAADEYLPVIGPSMAGLVEMLRVFALQDETVLLGGPTGAGKSRLARWCHEQSARRAAHFETLDLVTVPEDLQMGELFGWRKGAFTGALKDNPGCVARAEGGTLFVDEIDKLSLRAQAGLLHLLEERTYRPLGEGAGDRHADVRFVIGTNAELGTAVRAGRFREDLYYRIHVLPVKVPPLDQRRDEILLWAGFMASRRHRSNAQVGQARLSPEVERLLLRQSWPGNLRQLDNIVRRAYALALMDHGSAPRDLLLTERHFERALEYEDGAAKRPLLELLQEAATAFVAEAERRGEGASLDLDLAEALRGLVLAAATRRLGREEAFRLVGREALLANRNHHKALKRELERVEALWSALGQDLPPEIAELLDGKERQS